MPDDHSEVVPLLPIPNRTVKRLRADDSAGSRVKVGHRQAPTARKAPASPKDAGALPFGAAECKKSDIRQSNDADIWIDVAYERLRHRWQ